MEILIKSALKSHILSYLHLNKYILTINVMKIVNNHSILLLIKFYLNLYLIDTQKSVKSLMRTHNCCSTDGAET